MTLEALMRHAYQTASDVIAGGEEAVPTFLALNAKDELFIYGTPWRNEGDKDNFTSVFTLIFAAREIVRYVMVAEAWVVRRKVGDDLSDIKPSECPDRQEILSLVGIEEDCSMAGQAEIINPSDGGKARRVAKLVLSEPQQMTGRMTSLLPDLSWPKAPDGMVDVLEAALGKIGGTAVHNQSRSVN